MRRHPSPIQVPDSAGAAAARARVTPERVREIVAMDDQPVLRNLLITQSYHQLSRRVTRMLGGDDADWCVFATWASKTAGVFIREDEVPREFRRLLEKKEDLSDRVRELDAALCSVHAKARLFTADDLNPIGEVVEEIGVYIQGGNTTVFAELGLLFASFIETFEGDAEPDAVKLEAFLERLSPGETEPDEVELIEDRGRLAVTHRGGQDMLRAAMRHFHAAMFETDAKRKAELILLANALSGWHEQIRLDPYIRGSLEVPVDEILFSRANDALAQRLARGLLGRAQEALDRHFAPVGERVTEAFRELSTGRLMQMSVPGETLCLGEDLPAPRGRSLFPQVLSRIEHPELSATLERFGAAGDGRPRNLGLKARLCWAARGALVALRLRQATDAGSGAGDWSDLSQRMRYIFAYFRSRQRDAGMATPPFDPDQTAAILSGTVPGGEL